MLCYELTGKKRAYNERILQIDHGTFTPLVFSINGNIGRVCQKFYLRLAQMNQKRETFHNRFQVIRFEQSLLWVAKSSLLCLRGSRTVCRKSAEFEIDVDVSHIAAKI